MLDDPLTQAPLCKSGNLRHRWYTVLLAGSPAEQNSMMSLSDSSAGCPRPVVANNRRSVER